MLDHDLEIIDKARFHCHECNGKIEHHTQETFYHSYDSREVMLCLRMKCRLCWNEIVIPATKFDTGKLSRMVVSR